MVMVGTVSVPEMMADSEMKNISYRQPLPTVNRKMKFSQIF